MPFYSQDGAKLYMRHHKVPHQMQRRVQRWYDYSWSRRKGPSFSRQLVAEPGLLPATTPHDCHRPPHPPQLRPRVALFSFLLPAGREAVGDTTSRLKVHCSAARPRAHSGHSLFMTCASWEMIYTLCGQPLFLETTIFPPDLFFPCEGKK
ncbi:hypothetical protein HPB48_002530 [Haemaphysalis longicornis]|uniref:Uncharacterized protein n=1 Tax=Haemaphysalis longicornis TaxID=44386 RepID=A0A9J6GPG3_HAELO|nr:hypothetical protein HPB48_002530 [Haemaphysalis longicornis]